MKLREKPLERLVDADPGFFTDGETKGAGIVFECPLHENCCVGVHFENPIGGGVPSANAKVRWRRDGETFETLTLSPSIRVTSPNHDGCHWHGFVKNGRFETCGDSR